MATSTPPDRTNHPTRPLRPDERRAIATFAVVATVGMLALLVPGVVTGDPGLLALVTPIGMWVPAVAALVAGRRLRDGRSWTERLALTPLRPLGRLARQLAAVFGAFAAVAVATLLLGHALGVAPLDLANLSGYRAADPGLGLEEARRQVLLTTLALPLLALAYVALTLGEEVGWRGFAQTVVAPWGFWRASFVIAAFWGVWHAPLVAAYALAGEASWWEVPMIAVNLTLGGAALSVVRALTGSVWPAAFGHAVLNTVFVFAYSAPVLAGARDAVSAQLGFAAVGWVVWALALALAAPWVQRAAAVSQR